MFRSGHNQVGKGNRSGSKPASPLAAVVFRIAKQSVLCRLTWTLCCAALATSCSALNSSGYRPLANVQENLSEITPSWLSVTLYHPEQGLHEPTVVDLHAKNLANTTIRVTCVSNEEVTVSEAQKVCRNVAKLLRHQGAETKITVPRQRQGKEQNQDGSVDLDVEIRSQIHRAHFDNLAATLSCCTCALTPTKMEQAYIHSVRVRGRNGVTLSENRMQSRFVQYTGCGVAGTNALLDFFFREDHEKLGGDVANRDFSADFYRQIAQQTFNAKMRSDVLGFTQTQTRPSFQGPSGDGVKQSTGDEDKSIEKAESSSKSTSDENVGSAAAKPTTSPAETEASSPSPPETASPPPDPQPTAPVVDPDDESASTIPLQSNPDSLTAIKNAPLSAPLFY